MSDPNVKLALRVHDECNGSDVFGSDICTCRPYLLFGIEEAVKEAQNGGSGVVIYFRKEGRALGEVTKVCFSCTIYSRAESQANFCVLPFSILCTTPVRCVTSPRYSQPCADRVLGKRGVDRASEYFKR
jgi:hypothetical protein